MTGARRTRGRSRRRRARPGSPRSRARDDGEGALDHALVVLGDALAPRLRLERGLEAPRGVRQRLGRGGAVRDGLAHRLGTPGELPLLRAIPLADRAAASATRAASTTSRRGVGAVLEREHLDEADERGEHERAIRGPAPRVSNARGGVLVEDRARDERGGDDAVREPGERARESVRSERRAGDAHDQRERRARRGRRREPRRGRDPVGRKNGKGRRRGREEPRGDRRRVHRERRDEQMHAAGGHRARRHRRPARGERAPGSGREGAPREPRSVNRLSTLSVRKTSLDPPHVRVYRVGRPPDQETNHRRRVPEASALEKKPTRASRFRDRRVSTRPRSSLSRSEYTKDIDSLPVPLPSPAISGSPKRSAARGRSREISRWTTVRSAPRGPGRASFGTSVGRSPRRRRRTSTASKSRNAPGRSWTTR